MAVRRIGDDGVLHAALANERRQRARVDAAHADDAARGEPVGERLLGAEIRRVGAGRAEDGADRAGALVEIDGFDVFVVGPDIADVGEGEGDDLRGVGRVREDFLIAGHGGVEADFADRLADGAEPIALDHFAAGENQHAGVEGFLPAVILIEGHIGLSSPARRWLDSALAARHGRT